MCSAEKNCQLLLVIVLPGTNQGFYLVQGSTMELSGLLTGLWSLSSHWKVSTFTSMSDHQIILVLWYFRLYSTVQIRWHLNSLTLSTYIEERVDELLVKEQISVLFTSLIQSNGMEAPVERIDENRKSLIAKLTWLTEISLWECSKWTKSSRKPRPTAGPRRRARSCWRSWPRRTTSTWRCRTTWRRAPSSTATWRSCCSAARARSPTSASLARPKRRSSSRIWRRIWPRPVWPAPRPRPTCPPTTPTHLLQVLFFPWVISYKMR